jgi:hypothetical protein
MVLALDLDPTLLNHPAQHHFPCRDWKAVGQLPVGQAQMLHDCALGHVWAFARTSAGHFLTFKFQGPVVFDPNAGANLVLRGIRFDSGESIALAQFRRTVRIDI